MDRIKEYENDINIVNTRFSIALATLEVMLNNGSEMNTEQVNARIITLIKEVKDIKNVLTMVNHKYGMMSDETDRALCQMLDYLCELTIAQAV